MMDDADQISISCLRQCGCNINESIISFKSFDAKLLVTSLVKCLHIIDEKYKNKIAAQMPHSKAKRYNYSMKLSLAMKDLGYRHEIGYDTFMYPSERTTREILRFVVGKLPNRQTDIRSSSITGSDDDEEEMIGSLDTRIHQSLKAWMKNKYSILKKPQKITSFHTVPLDFPNILQHEEISVERVDYCEKYLDYVCNQTPNATWFLPSILTHNHTQYLDEQQKINRIQDEKYEDEKNWNEIISKSIKSELTLAKQLVIKDQKLAQNNSESKANILTGEQNINKNITDSRFISEVKYTQEQNKGVLAIDESGNILQISIEGKEQVSNQSLEEIEEKRHQELENIRNRIQSLQQKLQKMDIQIEYQSKEYSDNKLLLKEKHLTTDDLEKDFLIKKRTIDLLPNADENLKKLEKIVKSSTERFSALKCKWDAKKLLLLEEFERKKMDVELNKHESNDMLMEIKSIRSKMREYGSDIRDKELLLQKLCKKLRKLPKTIDRQVYVDRILGVVQNLESQNIQIRQILEDVKNVQRDMNNISESSKRTFGVVDDLIFRTASNAKEIGAKRQLNEIYQQIVKMRENFDEMVETVRAISNMQNEIRDLEYQTDSLNDKVENLEMKQIKIDLKEVEDDNENLAAKLKTMKKNLKNLKKNNNSR